MRDQVDFLFANKQSFLEVGSQASPKYPKNQVCNIFVIFQERGVE